MPRLKKSPSIYALLIVIAIIITSIVATPVFSQDDFTIHATSIADYPGVRFYQRKLGRLYGNEGLIAGGKLVSPSRDYELVMQEDGNLVIYERGRAVWATDTERSEGRVAIMQGDGNFVLYGYDGAYWDTGTNEFPIGDFIAMQNDGNIVIYDRFDGKISPMWSRF